MKMTVQDKQSTIKLDSPSFNRAFCARPGLRYAALRPYCKKLEFVTDGFSTDINYLANQIAKSLENYDPETDCLILTGTGIVNILIGYYLSTKFPDEPIVVAFFQKEIVKFDKVITPEDYEFYRLFPNHILKVN